jgi:fatty acid desaturase
MIAVSEQSSPQADSILTHELAKLRSISDLRGWWAIGVDYGAIAVCFMVADQLRHPLVTAIAWFFIAGRQVALFNLIHSSAHNALFTRRRSDEIADWLVGVPQFETVGSYRLGHLEHHAEITRQDPARHEYLHDDLSLQRRGPIGRTWVVFIRAFLGYPAVVALYGVAGEIIDDRDYRRKILIFWIPMIVLLSVSGLWVDVLLYWLIPLFWLSPIFHMWAEISDHFQAPNDLRNQHGVFYALFIKGHELYHGTHHKYPRIPFYRLRTATRLLERHGHHFEKTVGLFGFLRCVYSRKPAV